MIQCFKVTQNFQQVQEISTCQTGTGFLSAIQFPSFFIFFVIFFSLTHFFPLSISFIFSFSFLKKPVYSTYLHRLRRENRSRRFNESFNRPTLTTTHTYIYIHVILYFLPWIIIILHNFKNEQLKCPRLPEAVPKKIIKENEIFFIFFCPKFSSSFKIIQ